MRSMPVRQSIEPGAGINPTEEAIKAQPGEKGERNYNKEETRRRRGNDGYYDSGGYCTMYMFYGAGCGAGTYGGSCGKCPQIA